MRIRAEVKCIPTDIDCPVVVYIVIGKKRYYLYMKNDKPEADKICNKINSPDVLGIIEGMKVEIGHRPIKTMGQIYYDKGGYETLEELEKRLKEAGK